MNLPKVEKHRLLKNGEFCGSPRLPSPSELAHHFTCLGVPLKLSRKISFHILKRISCEGLERVNSWLKDLLVELLTGNPAPWTKRIRKMSWILWELRSLPLRVRVRVLRVNTFFVLKDVTPSQRKKFLSSMMSPNVYSTDVFSIIELGARMIKSHIKVLPYQSPQIEDYVYIRSRLKSQPTLNRTREYLVTSRSGEDFSLTDFHTYHDVFYKKGFTQVLSDLDGILDFHNPSPFKHRLDLIPIGVVSPIQEKGCKLRAIANPHPFIQWSLIPLGKATFDILRQLPSDYTHNQTDALPVIRQWMKSVGNPGNADLSSTSEEVASSAKIHSVDLSDATNQFPLDAQEFVLKTILGPKYLEQIEIFRWASRGAWQVHPSLRGDVTGEIRWTKGQPLGLYPSFSSFALAHNALLEGLRILHGGSYCIVGDDVAIYSSELHVAYLDALSQLRVSFSKEKSLSSNSLAEFVGHVIRPSGWFAKGKEGKLTPSSVLSRVMKHGEAEFNYVRKYIVTLPYTRESDALAKALFTYDAYPSYLGGGGHVDYPVTDLLPSADVTPLLKRHDYPGLMPAIRMLITNRLDNSLPDLWSRWEYRHLLPDTIRSNRIGNIPTISPKGKGKTIIARVVRKAGRDSFLHWTKERLLLA